MHEPLKHAPAARPPYKHRVRPEQPSLIKELLLLLGKIAAIVLIVLLAFSFLYGVHRNVDASMQPAIKDGDLILFYRLDKAYVAGDVLLLDYEGSRQVRRVIATAGDTVDITEDGLFINGALQQEPAIYEQTERYADGVSFPLTVGEGQVFVLADARENATDSRIYGIVSVENTLGKAITILRRRGI